MGASCASEKNTEVREETTVSDLPIAPTQCEGGRNEVVSTDDESPSDASDRICHPKLRARITLWLRGVRPPEVVDRRQEHFESHEAILPATHSSQNETQDAVIDDERSKSAHRHTKLTPNFAPYSSISLVGALRYHVTGRTE